MQKVTVKTPGNSTLFPLDHLVLSLNVEHPHSNPGQPSSLTVRDLCPSRTNVNNKTSKLLKTKDYPVYRDSNHKSRRSIKFDQGKVSRSSLVKNVGGPTQQNWVWEHNNVKLSKSMVLHGFSRVPFPLNVGLCLYVNKVKNWKGFVYSSLNKLSNETNYTECIKTDFQYLTIRRPP